MNTHFEVELWLHALLTSALSDQFHATATLTLGKSTLGIHWLGGWVHLRACLDAGAKRKNLPLSEIECQSSSLVTSHYID
jgi:predicted ATP-dependent Lon-type protease